MTYLTPSPNVVWLTGLSGAGKSTIAQSLAQVFRASGEEVFVLDGDQVREGLCSDLDFSDQGRSENVRRIGEVAKLILDAGQTVIVACISPFKKDREQVRQRIGASRFVEVFIDCPMAICEQRDPKKLYAKARSGTVQKMTGISSPYEPPEDPCIHIKTHELTVSEATQRIASGLSRHA